MKDKRLKREQHQAGNGSSESFNSSASLHNSDDEQEEEEIDENYDSQPNLEAIVRNRYKSKGFWIQFRQETFANEIIITINKVIETFYSVPFSSLWPYSCYKLYRLSWFLVNMPQMFLLPPR